MEIDNKFLIILNKFLGIIRNNVNLSSTFFRIIFSEIFSTFDIIQILRYKFGKARSFIFNGKELNYFYHTYHNQRVTERAIEIPIVRYYLENLRPENCLEIGNVTNHYYTYFQNILKSKVVVDKYEKGWGVINEDIKDYTIDEKFEFIFSIYTFEHMDSDRGGNPKYVKGKSKLCSYAADNILHVCNTLLKPGGLFIITTPVGQHIEWDLTLFKSGILNESFLDAKSVKIYYMKKTSEIEWVQTNIREAKKAKINYPFISVNCISIIEIMK